MSDDLLTEITESIVGGEPDETPERTRQALDSGLEPLTIINEGLVPRMNIVGEKFQSEECFLPHLIIAANGTQRAMESLKPELTARQQEVEAAAAKVGWAPRKEPGRFRSGRGAYR
jgi:5-methyltetrahydrofolate--homocysteine methyltransferase